jgi:hypothetical protein
LAVDPTTIALVVKVQGTYVSGKSIDLDAFLAQVEATDPSEHNDLPVNAKSYALLSITMDVNVI